MVRLFVLLIAFCIGVVIVKEWHEWQTRHGALDAPVVAAARPASQRRPPTTFAEPARFVEPALAAPAPSPFQCDGRTRCPQMHSCAEATYFIQHCPGTQMDGDGDGLPCEDQWCGH